MHSATLNCLAAHRLSSSQQKDILLPIGALCYSLFLLSPRSLLKSFSAFKNILQTDGPHHPSLSHLLPGPLHSPLGRNTHIHVHLRSLCFVRGPLQNRNGLFSWSPRMIRVVWQRMNKNFMCPTMFNLLLLDKYAFLRN